MRAVIFLSLAGGLFAQSVQQWENSKKFTLEVAEKMPAEKYGFKASDAEMAFGALMYHIAGSQVFRFQQVSGVHPPTRFAKAPTGKLGKEDFIETLRESFDYVISVLPKLTPEQLNRMYKVDWREKPEASGKDIALAMFVHTAHHRAQAEVYLRLNGIAPPVYLF